MKDIITYSILFLLLLSSCTKSDGGSDAINNKDINKEFIIRSDGVFSKSNILAEKYSNFYPAQVLDKKLLVENGIFSEIQTEVSPHSLIFEFYPIPYIEEILVPKGVLSFTNVLANAMRSEEWKIYNESGVNTSQLISCAIYSSKEEAKAFLGEPSLYKLIDESGGDYIFLAKIISSKFNLLTGIKDRLTDKNLDDACYVSSVTFGHYAYLSISTNKNPERIMDLFINGILKKDVTYVDQYLKISSSVNVVERGGSDHNGYWGEAGFYKLIEIFDLRSNYTGVPISFELRDATTREIISL